MRDRSFDWDAMCQGESAQSRKWIMTIGLKVSGMPTPRQTPHDRCRHASLSQKDIH